MPTQITKQYTVTSDITFSDTFDLTAGDIKITYTIDMSGYAPAPPEYTAWTSVGLTGGASGWMSSGAPYAYVQDNNNLDLDDKHNLGAPNRYDETSYDATGQDTVIYNFGNSNNYGIWFDRTGVDQYQAQYWGAVDGGTYNTNGKYNIEIIYHAVKDNQGKVSDSLGTMFATVNGIKTGFYTNGWKNAQPEIYPAGKSITGNLKNLQVFVSGFHNKIKITNLTVEGFPAAPITSGPIVADKEAKSLVVKVLNNTNLPKTVTVTIFDIGGLTKQAVYSQTFTNIPKKSAVDAVFAAPPTEYEIVFEGVVQGVEVWAAARKNTPKTQLKDSLLIPANTFKNTDFVPLL